MCPVCVALDWCVQDTPQGLQDDNLISLPSGGFFFNPVGVNSVSFDEERKLVGDFEIQLIFSVS